jgi:asparagine synthase (glutamine-hydrolysing)
MCGIAGFAGQGMRADIAAMTQAIEHRGPDADGFYFDPAANVHLGFRRLAIRDVAGGAQPMADGTGQVVVVFNGEIYNDKELRTELEAKGHRFRSDHSDTEVLVHGYKEWGDELPARLNGMFAFGVYDSVRRRFLLARDRMGEKPLFFAHRDGLFAFASELTALTRHHALSAAAVDPMAVRKLFAYGFIPAPRSLYSGIHKLPHGCRLTIDLASHTLKVTPYWRFSIQPDHALQDSDLPVLAEELRALLQAAVQRRLVSDVPLGVLLSGGIDSSTTLALMARLVPPGQIDAFTIGFREPSYDESDYARVAAQAIGIRLNLRTLDFGTSQAIMPNVLSRLDEPMGDPSILPTYLLCRFAREKVTVALSGDGADELFAGYDPFKALTPAKLYNAVIPKRFHKGLRRLAELIPLSDRNMSFDFKIRRFLSGAGYAPALWNPVWMAPEDPVGLSKILAEPVSADDLYGDAIQHWDDAVSNDPVDRTLEYFTNFYLPESILTKVDRASMMVSLESRAIFLDNDVVEFCRRLPSRFKFHKGYRKRILKEAIRGLVPENILTRGKKGFGIPLAAWLRSTVPPGAVPGTRSDVLATRWHEHRRGEADHRLLLWNWLVLHAHLASVGRA